MRIQHNIMAMNAYRNYTNNVSAMKANLEKLSSGYKINRAGDDAAGLAISEKMRAQITGLETAQKNAKDGISLVQTAEGALTEVHDMLNRMVELATQSANGTYDNTTDRLQLQKEMDQLNAEINRIADSANFNGIKLLNGDMNGKAVATQLAETFAGETFLPPAGDGLGVDTVLNKKTEGPIGTSFTATLGNVTFANGEDDTFTLKVGDTKLTLDGVANGKEMSANEIVSALAAKYDGSTPDKTVNFKSADGSDQAFTVTASGNKLTFTQKSAPLTEGQIVDAPKSITASKSASKGTAGEYTYKIDNAFGAGETLKIGGKEVTFFDSTDGSGKTGNIDVNSVNTANDQATAIANLFAGDANWTVKDDGAGTLTFTQVNADPANALTAEISGAGEVVGVVNPVAVGTEFDAGKPITHSLTFTANAARGETYTIGSSTVTFVSKGQGDVAKGRIEVGATTKDTVANLAAYFNAAEDSEFTAVADGDKLTLTEKVAGSSTAPVIANNKNVNGVAAAAPKLEELQVADGTNKGKWKLDFNNCDFQNNDQVKILGQTIKIDSAGTASATVAKPNSTSAQDIATAVAAALQEAGGIGAAGGTFTVTDNGDGSITLEQATASNTTNVLTAGNVVAGSSVTSSAAALPATLATDNTGAANATAASWNLKIGTAFKDGDTLTIKLGDTEKTITFKDDGSGDIQTGAGNAQNAEDQAAAVAALLTGGAFDDFTVTSDADGNIIFTQNKAIDPATGGADASTIETSTSRAVSGKGTVTEVTEAKAGAEGGEVTDFLVDTSLISEGSVVNGERLASTIFKLDDIVKDGNTFKVADQTFTFKVGADSTTEAADGATLIDLSKSKDVLRDAYIQLTNLTKNNSVFEAAGFDGENISFLEKVGQTEEDLSTFENMAAQFSYSTAATTAVKGRSLTLQIGDTADDYNQLKVDIQDMHAASLGLDKIKISDQDSAAKAVDVIKAAINTVSDVRGTLGATQNRLDHTINNLSVMTENIQDAESTIRDTDVAAEMMAYTKNNILIQSAQAMLAQANQVPQGVLQLLQ